MYLYVPDEKGPATHTMLLIVGDVRQSEKIMRTHFNSFVYLLLALAGMFFSSQAQVSLHEHTPGDCSHFCAKARLDGPSIGIYDQDARLHDYDVKFYGLDLEVNPASTFIEGSVRVLAEITSSATRYMVLELWDELSVSQVVSGEENLSFQHTDNVLEIDLGQSQPMGTMMDVSVFYSGEPSPEGFFSGIQSETNSYGDPVLWTLSEPHNARQWFPVKQVLNDKADSVDVFITTPAGFVAASNGLLDQVTELDDGRNRYEWKSRYPIAYYLISMAVGNYQEFSFMAPLDTPNDSVWVQNFIYNYAEVLESQRENIEKTSPLMQMMSELWGTYPFWEEKYGHAQAPMGGAMEHQTMSTMGYFGFDITAHELAHHWFGNNVTCATWSDIWINEGFATYAEFLAREFLVGAEHARDWMDFAHNNIKSLPDGSVYVPPVFLYDVWRIFSGRLSYRKGAAILHQLRFEINDDSLFFNIMEEFQETFADSIATGDDFRKTVDGLTGQDWEWFFDQWYYGEGFPTYEIMWWQKDGNLHIQSSQVTSASYPLFFAGAVEFNIVFDDNSMQMVRFFQQENLQEFVVEIPQGVKELIFDPRHFMLKNYQIWDSTNIPVPDTLSPGFYPNPVVGKFTIDYPEEWHNGNWQLSDVNGRVWIENTLNRHSQEQDLGPLPAGVYVLTLCSPEGEIKTFKLLKQ